MISRLNDSILKAILYEFLIQSKIVKACNSLLKVIKSNLEYGLMTNNLSYKRTKSIGLIHGGDNS